MKAGLPPLADSDRVIDLYFKENSLIAHQLSSFDEFLLRKLDTIIASFNPIEIYHQHVPERDVFRYKVKLSFSNAKLSKPVISEKDGGTKLMTPNDARLRNLTYSSPLTADLKIECDRYDETSQQFITEIKTISGVTLGKIPIMVRSRFCMLGQDRAQPTLAGSERDGAVVEECRYDPGGYFIINGNEKVIVSSDRIAENRVFIFPGTTTSTSSLYSLAAEIRSVPYGSDCSASPKTTVVKIASRDNQFGRVIRISMHHIKVDVPLFIIFRALGVETDRKIMEFIVPQNEESLKEQLVASAHEAAESDIKCEHDALEYLSKFLQISGYPKEILNNRQKRMGIVRHVLLNDFLPHVSASNLKCKALYLGYMTRKLLKCHMKLIPADDRDSYLHKRIDAPGTLLANLFRQCYSKMIKDLRAMVQKDINTGPWRATGQICNVISKSNVYKLVKSSVIEGGLKYALSTGTWGLKTSKTKQGVAQVLNRLTYNAAISHLRRLNTPLEKSGKLVAPRKLHATTFGYICPAETPEGSGVGLVKNLSMSTTVSLASCAATVRHIIANMPSSVFVAFNGSNIDIFSRAFATSVIVNGDILGVALDPPVLYTTLKRLKLSGALNVTIAVVWDVFNSEIRVSSEGGRLIRPLFTVSVDGDTKEQVDVKMWRDLVFNGQVEFLDVEESNAALIAMSRAQSDSSSRYTHMEIHPSLMLGALAGAIPFSDHNQAPRNCYQSSMGKQAIGLYAINYRHRYDTIAHILNYPQVPLAQTKISKIVKTEEMPSGANVIVAIMCATGFNQEDSVIINKGAIDRGLFSSTVYKTLREQNSRNHSNGEEEFFIKPNPNHTLAMKPFNYEKLSENGFVPENTMVEAGDIVIGKTMPQKRDSVIVYKDTSVSLKSQEPETYIDRNCHGDRYFTNINGDGYVFAKVRTRNLRVPTIGDKFSCYSSEHEVLTLDHGWVPFPQLSIEAGHKVATLVDGDELVYQVPTEVQHYPDYNGKMYCVRNAHVDLLVTPNHRMYVRKMTGNDLKRHPYETPRADDVFGLPRHYKKNAAVWNGASSSSSAFFSLSPTRQVDMKAWMEFVICWYVGVDTTTIHSTLNTLGLLENNSVVYDAEESSWQIYDPDVIQQFADCLNVAGMESSEVSFSGTNARLPNWLLHLPMDLSRYAVDLMLRGKMIFETKSVHLRDQFQQLCLHAGGSSKFFLNPDSGQWQCDPTWSLHINEPLVNCGREIRRETWVDYNGAVHCCTVPLGHGVLYVRQGNTKPPVWCGNSKHGQKGTVGMILNQEDMPFTKDGIVPDIIINPHAIPSRMTIAQLMECLMSKACLFSGTYGDATPFSGVTVERLASELARHGCERYGNEILYNARTGEQIVTDIFIGPTFYQRLKHMTTDKVHSRANAGPVVLLTRQPAEGRSRDGGLRIGEMEEEVHIAHGITSFLKERFMECSDNFRLFVCKTCNSIATAASPENNIYVCKHCRNTATHFAEIRIPYAAKLLFQELQTMAIGTKFLTSSMSAHHHQSHTSSSVVGQTVVGSG
jgi:DNA-directed RNA polymerase II subunit RPB2